MMGATVGAFASAPFGTVREGVGRAHGRGLAGLSCIVIRYRRVSHYLKPVEAKELGVAGLLRWDCAAAIKPFLSFLPSFLLLSHRKFLSARTTAPTSTDRPTQVSHVSFGAAIIIRACVHQPWASTIKHSVNLSTRLSGDRSLVPAFPSFLHSLRFLFATLLSIHARSLARSRNFI